MSDWDYSWQPQCYSQLYLTLAIPGNRLNTRNAPGAHSYHSHGSNKPQKFNTTKFFNANYFLHENFPIYGSNLCIELFNPCFGDQGLLCTCKMLRPGSIVDMLFLWLLQRLNITSKKLGGSVKYHWGALIGVTIICRWHGWLPTALTVEGIHTRYMGPIPRLTTWFLISTGWRLTQCLFMPAIVWGEEKTVKKWTSLLMPQVLLV